MQIKGWMIDAARLPEPLPCYRQVIDFCAAWGFNTILFRLADDQGSALHFASHPELATHPHAFTADELAGLARYAAGRGIQLIPEIESFGHTGYITRSPIHATLMDNDPASGSSYTGVIPNHPDTLALMADLYREAADIFPSTYLHGGCDEVNWGGSAFSQAAIRRQGRAGVWTDYLNRLNVLARGLGKELMVWADHVLGSESDHLAVLQGLSREIILVDWSYWDSDPARGDGASPHPGPIESRARLALARGFRLAGAPAWGWCRWGVRAGESQLRNIDAYADIYRAIPDPRCLGLIVTHWVPSRLIPGAAWDGAAYTGAALEQGSAAARLAALPRFVREHYVAEWDETWADIFHTLYHITPPRRACSPGWMAPFQPPVWADEAGLAALLADQSPPFASDLPWARLRAQVAACAAKVQRNLPDFQAFALSVEYLEHIHWRCAAVIEARANPAQRATLLQTIARRDAQLVEAMTRAWDAARFTDDPAKERLLVDLSLEDQSLLALRRAAQFTARLAANPGETLKV
jgi:hypothetical protein